jgi:hypothetical protein
LNQSLGKDGRDQLKESSPKTEFQMLIIFGMKTIPPPRPIDFPIRSLWACHLAQQRPATSWTRDGSVTQMPKSPWATIRLKKKRRKVILSEANDDLEGRLSFSVLS